MDFFQEQDIARRNLRLLTLLFLVAVLLLILLTNLLVAAFLWLADDYNIYNGGSGGWAGFLSYFSWQRFGTIGLAVTSTVALVVMLKWMQLSSGGKAVAESMGGSRIVPQTRDRLERRCLNVVDEVALAANMPVPPVYVLNGERGINAFAAGLSPADAVIAVTRGTLEHLKRHELQGVIAHEFSHILNGDMRLNIRLAAMLKGITFIGDVGHILLHSSHRARSGLSEQNTSKRGAMPILGLALWLLGWLGGLAAGFIKAAISRQKEFLADACAVQYTRDASGISDALKVIGGYLPGTLVHTARAAEMSHIFFGQIEHQLWQVFATHPPLDARIRKLEPQWNGQYISRKVKHYQEQPSRPGAAEVGVGRAALVAAVLAANQDLAAPALEFEEQDQNTTAQDQFDEQTAERFALPVAFIEHSHNPLGAQGLCLALLISNDHSVQQQQLAHIDAMEVAGLAALVLTLTPGVAALGPSQRLPLLELCLPALKSMSLAQYRRFKNTLLVCIQADRRTELFEWCLFQLLRHYLDPEFLRSKASRPRYRKLTQVKHSLQVLLSVLARESGANATAAFNLAASELELQNLQLLAIEKCSVAEFSKAVYQLADCYPLLKPRVIKAMTKAAGCDAELSPAEREIIYSVAAVMDCPLPLESDWLLTQSEL